MGNITLVLPNELQKKMKEHSEIRWSEVIRKTIQKKIEDLDLLDKLTLKSKLTHKEAFNISKKIDASVARKLGLIS
ncbi:hypothetical protein HYX16_04510 [Candidatus Woesearchaeota archaeon]|nr:hypothetical protein [Candidatus Woesearchaeota archaeon]